MHIILAGLATWIVYFFANRVTTFATRDYNTQAYVDPNSLPDRSLLNKADEASIIDTQNVKIPMAQIASPTGELYAPNRLNPSLPAMQFGNTLLDTPTPLYAPNRTG